MKLNDQLLNNAILPLDPKVCACGEVIAPLIPVANPEPSSREDLTPLQEKLHLYSHRGFIKGISVLNKLKKLKYGFSTRRFGNMAFKFGDVETVVKNRREFIKAAGMNIKNTVFMLPNHGKGVEVVNSSHKGRGAFGIGTGIGPADALITFDKGVALGLNSADCVPLIMTTKNTAVLAVVHAGRIGTDAGIAKTTIRKLTSLGVKPQDLIVGIGPAIQKECYKLGYLETNNPYQWLPWITPVFKSGKIVVEKNIGTGKQYKIKSEKGKILVDIIGFNVRQLLDMGVKSDNIDIVPVCALCQARKGEIYSHFLSAQYRSNLYPEGRFMTIAQLS